MFLSSCLILPSFLLSALNFIVVPFGFNALIPEPFLFPDSDLSAFLSDLMVPCFELLLIEGVSPGFEEAWTFFDRRLDLDFEVLGGPYLIL